MAVTFSEKSQKVTNLMYSLLQNLMAKESINIATKTL